MSFEFDKAQAILQKCTIEKDKDSEDGSSSLKHKLALFVTVDTRARKAVEEIFPGHESVEAAISLLDGECPGVQMSAQANTPEIGMTIFDGSGVKEIFKLPRITVVGKPSLKINSIGDSVLTVNVSTHLSKADRAMLGDFVDAGIYVTIEEVQLGLPGVGSTPTPPPKAVNRAAEALRPIAIDDDDDDDESEEGEAVEQDLPGTGTSANQLKAWREEAGLTRSDMIDRLEMVNMTISAKSLQRYEMGTRSIPEELPRLVKEICHVE